MIRQKYPPVFQRQNVCSVEVFLFPFSFIYHAHKLQLIPHMLGKK